MGEAPTVQSLGRQPTSCQAGTMDRCGGRETVGRRYLMSVAAAREARAQDHLGLPGQLRTVPFWVWLGAQAPGHPAHGPLPTNPRKRGSRCFKSESRLTLQCFLEALVVAATTLLPPAVTSGTATTTDTAMSKHSMSSRCSHLDADEMPVILMHQS